MKTIEEMNENEIIEKYEEIKEDIRIKTEQLKLYKQKQKQNKDAKADALLKQWRDDMDLRLFLQHFDKELTPVYKILKDIPKEDLAFAFTNIIQNETYLGKGYNLIPYIYAYLPNGYKTIYKSLVWKLAKYTGETDENGYLMIYKKVTLEERKLIEKLGGMKKIKRMDRDKLYYQIKELTEISTQKLLENKEE